MYSYRNAHKAQTGEEAKRVKKQQQLAARKKRQDAKLPAPLPVKSSIQFPKLPADLDKSKVAKRRVPVTGKKVRKTV